MRGMERLNKSCPRVRGKLLVSGTTKRLPGRGAGNTPQGGLTEGLTIPSEATFFFNPSVCSRCSHPPPLLGQAGGSTNPKAVPACGGFEPSAPSGRCSEGRIGRNREYCKRQRCKTTIFQPAFVAANVMSSRKGNGSKLPSAARCSPSVSLRSTALPACGGAFWHDSIATLRHLSVISD